MNDKKNTHILIEGVTETGEVFRPHDWAERMCGSLCTFRNQRMNYSPLLQPIVKNGYKCLIIDKSLETLNPELFQSILEFAHNNKLKIHKEE